MSPACAPPLRRLAAGWAGVIAPQVAASGVGTAHPTGLLLLAWLIFTTYMTAAAVRVSVVVGVVFTTLTLAFALLTAGALCASSAATAAGGWVGIICACAAWYGSAAVVINSVWDRTVLPVGVWVSVVHTSGRGRRAAPAKRLEEESEEAGTVVQAAVIAAAASTDRVDVAGTASRHNTATRSASRGSAPEHE